MTHHLPARMSNIDLTYPLAECIYEWSMRGFSSDIPATIDEVFTGEDARDEALRRSARELVRAGWLARHNDGRYSLRPQAISQYRAWAAQRRAASLPVPGERE